MRDGRVYGIYFFILHGNDSLKSGESLQHFLNIINDILCILNHLFTDSMFFIKHYLVTVINISAFGYILVITHVRTAIIFNINNSVCYYQ